jgi:23S rRNA (cytosine1962-C5)-methyltransferase
MDEAKFRMFRNRLMKVSRHLGRQAKRLNISCFRLYDHDLPEFPLSIDVYEENVYVAEYKRWHGMSDADHNEWIQKSMDVICEVLEVKEENFFLKLRQKKARRSGQYRKFENTKSEFIVQENGLKFIVNLSDYIDTGLFPDHRITRQMVRSESAGKKLLNLFAYTGSFSVYAAAGGASEVTTVDLSKTYLAWAGKNMRLNGFSDASKYKYVQADVIQFLKTTPDSGFDLIILDPPTFSNSKRMNDILDVQRDHVQLIHACLRILKPGGILYFSTNYHKFILEKEKLHSAFIKDITRQTTPFDFAGRLQHFCWRLEK